MTTTCDICNGTGEDQVFGGACTACTEEGQAAVAALGLRPGRSLSENTDFNRGNGRPGTGSPVTQETATDAQRRFLLSLGYDIASHPGHLTKRDASRIIDELKAAKGNEAPVTKTETRRANKYGSKCIRCGQWVEAEAGYLAKDASGKWAAEHAGECPEAPAKGGAPAVELTDGMYRTPDGEIYKVQIAHHGSGNLYAKRLVIHGEGDGEFEYAKGAMRKLRPEMKMTLEEAKEFGRLYGVCCVCAAVLTDENSIAEGIGPVCGAKANRFA